MLTPGQISEAAAALDAAETTRRQTGLLSLKHPGMTMDDAYAVQAAWVKKKIASGRRVVGWSMATDLRTRLVLDALNMALAQRNPKEVIHHSDQGCPYTSLGFGARCREAGVRPSMGAVGDAYDNALCEMAELLGLPHWYDGPDAYG